MERYIGIDVHAQSCTMAVSGPSGKRLGAQILETRAEALVEAVRKVRGKRYICIEEGTQSQWLYELLEPHAQDVVVVVPEQNRGQKSDERDAWGLTEIAREGKARTRVHKAPVTMAGLREAARGYRMLTKDVARVKNRIKAVYRSRGLWSAKSDVYRRGSRKAWVAQLPASSRALVELLGDELDALEPLKSRAEERLSEEAKGHPEVRRLQTVPGLGEIRASQVVAVMVTPHRFRTSRQLWSYSGLSVVTRASAEWIRQGAAWVRSSKGSQTRGLTRQRNPTLKSVFKSAATTVISRMPTHPLHQDYQRTVAAGTKPNLAKLTLARRIAAICLAIWKNQEDYDPQKARRRTPPA
jgi:transposase